MASSLFEIDDQTDEDFFDRLIEDEVELPVQPVTSNASVHETQAVSADAGQTVVDSGFKSDVGTNDDGNNVSIVGTANDQAYSEFKSFHQENEVTDTPVDKAVGESDTSLLTRIDDETVTIVDKEGSLSPGAGIREVDWSVFTSQSHVQNNAGIGSYFDFFGSGGDPFANLDSCSSGAYVKTVEGNGENSVPGSFLVDQLGVQNQKTDVSLNTYDHNLHNQYSENLYPGWRFDPDTGLWHQLDNFDAISNDNLSSHNVADVTSVGDNQVDTFQVSKFDNLQESLQSVTGISEGVSSSVKDLNDISQSDFIYPESMVFDPQYPGWYYDTTVGEWRTLESYTLSVSKSEISDLNQQDQPTYISPGGEYPVNNLVSYVDNHIQGYHNESNGSFTAPVVATSNVGKQHTGMNIHMWQPEPMSKEDACTSTTRSQNTQSYCSEGYSENMSHQFLVHSSEVCPENTFHQPTVPPSNRWSNDRRPYHPLVTFGFGGKLILIKSDNHFGTIDAYETQNAAGRVINVLSLSDIIMDRTQSPSTGMDTTDYFAALYQQSFPGPLVGGSVGMKEINKWVDEKIVNYDNSYFTEGKTMKLLFALLKVACKHYGKLRSPFGGDYPLPGKESPEFTVGDLFASLKTNNRATSGTVNPIIQSWPLEGQVQATASEMQKLLISGRKKEALECAKLGHLWGPAMVLAAQLGDQFYSETMKEMALQQFITGSPLRTLYLLIAGKPNDVFANSNTNGLVPVPGVPSGILPSMQAQIGSNPLLDDWVENLSVIMANRTKDDEFAIIHLGDCLWKERSEVIGAHICYLVADTNFEPYSDSARLCLIGADHIKCSRTYAHPEAIQRTELYEYSKMLGNAQFTLFPFLPYKLIYAQMLAEVGKLSESMKYCQAISKILKSGRGQEELCKQLVSSLEDRIRTHQQAGYATNSAPVKLVGKLLSAWSNARGSAGPTPTVSSPSSSTFQLKDVGSQFSHAPQFSGGLPPLVPSLSSDKFQHKDGVPQFSLYRVTNSQSTLSMSTLVPQPESVSKPGDADTKLVTPNRSISEPDIGKTPKEEPQAQLKSAVSTNPSRFGRFGFGSQILQKTVGLVLRPRSGKQAKLGEKNKFYYDEKLKRWVEEGAEAPIEEVALPPPPTTGSFQNKESDHDECLHKNNAPAVTSNAKSPGMSPPDPAGPPPQLSGRGRVGVRSRYVDTFNKAGGGSSNLFKPPPITTVRSGLSPNPTFFVPPATDPVKEALLETADGHQNAEEPSELLATTYNEANDLRTPESGEESGSAYATPSTSLHGSSVPYPPHMLMPSTSSDYSSEAEVGRTVSWKESLADEKNISNSPKGEPYESLSTPNGVSFNKHNNSSDDLREVDL